MFDDDGLPGASALLGADAPALLEAALAPAGGRVEAARRWHVAYTPGRRLVVSYAATVSWPDGRRTDETLGAVVDRDGSPRTAAVVTDGALAVGVWRYPHDPWLPGLPSALDPVVVRALLDRLGGRPGPVQLAVRAYRPARRAVVEAVTTPYGGPGQRLFLKVVKPRHAADLHHRHVALAEVAPIPPSFGYDADRGIVALQAMPGHSLGTRLEVEGAPLPSPAAVQTMLAGLATVTLPARRYPGPLEDAARHAALLTAVLPAAGGRVRRLRERLGQSAQQETGTVHGDLYESQLLVGAHGTVTGLLDVDRAGPGAPIDDVANFLGHLRVLALVRPSARARARDFATALEDEAAARWDRRELRRRAAAVVLGLATGPYRMQQHGWREATARHLTLAEGLAGAEEQH